MPQPNLCAGFAGLSLLASIGCATVTGGARDPKVAVTSNPPGAAVVVDGQPRGVTPTTVELSRKSDHEVVIQQTSYETAIVPVKRQFNPWIFGNVLIGGLPGIIVDVATDATHCLSTDKVHVDMKGQNAVIGDPPNIR